MLTTDLVFTTIALYNPVRVMMTLYWPWGIQQLSEGRVSTQRIQEFLLLDEKDQKEVVHDEDRPHPTNCKASAQNASATWDKV